MIHVGGGGHCCAIFIRIFNELILRYVNIVRLATTATTNTPQSLACFACVYDNKM